MLRRLERSKYQISTENKLLFNNSTRSSSFSKQIFSPLKLCARARARQHHKRVCKESEINSFYHSITTFPIFSLFLSLSLFSSSPILSCLMYVLFVKFTPSNKQLSRKSKGTTAHLEINFTSKHKIYFRVNEFCSFFPSDSTQINIPNNVLR